MPGPPVEKRPGVNDPDGQIMGWLARHNPGYFPQLFNELVLHQLSDSAFSDGASGKETLSYVDPVEGEAVEVEVRFLLEAFPRGRIFHVLSVWSPGDPSPR
jgi:hypothetical protein